MSKFRLATFGVIVLSGMIGWLLTLYPHVLSFSFSKAIAFSEVLDSLYRSIQLFVLGFDNPDGKPGHWLLRLARWAAAIWSVLAIINLILGTKLRFLLNSILHRRKPAYLIVGYGKLGQAIGQALRSVEEKDRRRIVAIDRTVDNITKREAADHHIELYQCDVQAPDALKWIPLNPVTIDGCYVSVGEEDLLSLAIAHRLSGNLPQAYIWSHCSSHSLLGRLRDVPHPTGPGSVEAFSLHEAQAEQFVCSHPPVKLAQDQGQRRVHAVILGLDDATWATAEQIMLNASFPPPTFSRPRLTFLVEDADSARMAWEARYPEIYPWVTVSFLEFPREGANAIGPGSVFAKVELLDPPTIYVIGGDSTRIMSTALQLRGAMSRGNRRPAPIHLLLHSEMAEPLPEVPLDRGDLQKAFTQPKSTRSALLHSMAINDRLKRIAIAIFGAYAPKERPQEDLLASFHDEERSLQISNRRAAIHAIQKLALLGFADFDIEHPALGFGDATLDTAKQVATPAWVGPFESIRWAVDRASDDWRPTAMRSEQERDDESRRRTQMNYSGRDYSQLDKHEKDIDIRQFDAVLEDLRSRTDKRQTATYLASGPTLQAVWSTQGGLRLELRDDEEFLAACTAGSPQRITIRVPAEPALLDESIEKNRNVRSTNRRSAYASFTRRLLKDLPDGSALHFQRSTSEGWLWLSEAAGPTASTVTGASLPPLSIGVAGHINLDRFDSSTLAGTIDDRLRQIAAADPGRPMRLIVGDALGADRLVTERFLALGLGQVLVLASNDPKPTRTYFAKAIATDQLLVEPIHSAFRGNDCFAEISNRLRDSIDLLLAIYDGRDEGKDERPVGGTGWTIKLMEESNVPRSIIAPG